MDIAGLINRFGGDRQDYAGAFYTASIPIQAHSFTATIEFLRTDDSLYFEGGIVRAGHDRALPFRFSLPFKSMNPYGGTAELKCELLGSVSGELLTCGAGFEFIGQIDGNVVALHVTFNGSESLFVLSGMVRTRRVAVAFSAAPAAQWQATAQAKIYSLRARS